MAQADTDQDSTADQVRIPDNEAELVEMFAEFANRHGTLTDETKVADRVGTTHRYLQKEMFDSVLKPLIIGLAAQGKDARNARVVEECRDIVDEMGWYVGGFNVEVPSPEEE
jgi:hypothetical protein